MAGRLLSHLIPGEIEALSVGLSAFDKRCGRRITRFIHQMIFSEIYYGGREFPPPTFFPSVRWLFR